MVIVPAWIAEIIRCRSGHLRDELTIRSEIVNESFVRGRTLMVMHVHLYGNAIAGEFVDFFRPQQLTNPAAASKSISRSCANFAERVFL